MSEERRYCDYCKKTFPTHMDWWMHICPSLCNCLDGYDNNSEESHDTSHYKIMFGTDYGKKVRPDVPHYEGQIEPIDVIREWGKIWKEDTWEAGNCIKYLRRFRQKGTPLEDLKKARNYLTFLIGKYEE